MPETEQEAQTPEQEAAAQAAAAQAEASRRQAEYDAQPRVRLQKILKGLHGNHFDVRDRLGVLTRAVAELVGMAHDAAPAEPDADTPPPPPQTPPTWPRQ